jgi:hypothetical protein
MDEADLLAGVLGQQTKTTLSTTRATVVDVTDTGRVNLQVLGTLVPEVRCSDAYRNRQAGDTVIVQLGARPTVLYRLGDDPADTDAATIRELAEDAAQDLVAISAYTWGTGGPPGSGWQQVSTLWTKKDGAGKGVLYAQLASTSDTSPDAPATRAPKAVTVTPTDSGAWRSGRPMDGSDPSQGDWTGRGNRRGGWFYGTKIASACSGKTVAKMTVKFTRKRGSGRNAKVPMHLYLHNYTSAPSGQLNLGDGPEELLRLSVGAKGTATLPASWRSALASGSARGLAIYDTGSSDYSAYTGGQITITFSAS